MPERDVRWAYAVLGLPFGATATAAQQAYRDLVAVWHPDRFTDNARRKDLAHKKTQDLNAAIALIRTLKPPEPSAAPTRTPPSPPQTPPGRKSGGQQRRTTQTTPPPSTPPPAGASRDRPSALEVFGRSVLMLVGFGVMCLFIFDLNAGLLTGRLRFGWSLLHPHIIGILIFGWIGWSQLQALRRKHRWAWDRNR